MSRHIFIVLTLVLLAVTTPVKGGVVVFDNLGSLNWDQGAWFGTYVVGTETRVARTGTNFIPNVSGTMDGIDAAIFGTLPDGVPYEMTLFLSVDSGGQPGSTHLASDIY